MLNNGINSKAFVFSKKVEQANTTHQVKLSLFINLVQTGGMAFTTGENLPEESQLKEHSLYFIDLYEFNEQHPISEQVLELALKHRVVLFNCQHDFFCEKKALLSGINGIFYCDDRADIILKGIEYLTQNGRWFRRKTMNLALADLLNPTPQMAPKKSPFKSAENSVFPSLTKREKTIINLVSSGAQNKEIAEQLHISPNTVKTHIYSIFRKTSSRNRIELITWSQQLNH